MSQRTYIIGFKLEELKKLYGSKNDVFINDITRKYDSDFDKVIQNEDEKIDAHKIIIEFIEGKSELHKLEETSDLFTELLKKYLVFYNQDILWTEMEHSGFYLYLENVINKIKNDDVKKLFDKLNSSSIFYDGRPINADSQYAFLIKENVKKVNDYIEDNKETFQPYSDLGRAFINSIRQLSESNKDLFLYTS